MNKLLKWLGISCGVLILVAVVLYFFGGYFIHKWYYFKTVRAITQLAEAGKLTKAQRKELKKINAVFPFVPPAEGELIRLEESRLQDYLKVRSSALPRFNTLHSVYESELPKVYVESRNIFIAALRAKKMSLVEYHYYTLVIYGLDMDQALDSDATIRASKQVRINLLKIRMNSPNIAADGQQSIQKEIEELQLQLQSLNQDAKQITPSNNPELTKVNNALIEKYRFQIDELGNVKYDLSIATDVYPGGRRTPFNNK